MYTAPALRSEEAAPLRRRLLGFLQVLADDDGPAAPEAGTRAGDDPSAPRPHLAIPVIGLNKVIGVLFVERADPAYAEDDLRLLTVIAAQLGFFLTTLRLREEEIEQARKLGSALQQLEQTDRKKDEFLAVLGHELRNPLGAINSALHLIDARGAEEVQRYHRIIDRQIKHLSRIVDDLLDASRVRLGKIVLERRPVDLNDLARRWMETYVTTQPVRQHDVQLMLDSEPVPVHGDPVRLEQVFSNLMSNALKYTPEGGHIRVTTSRHADRAVITVRDDGVGMTATVLGSVFELFTQADESLARSQGGLGIGLPLVRSLVEMHGGSVGATSEGLGRGSEFVVELPLAQVVEARAEAPEAAEPSCEGGERLRVLLVEDNDDARELLVAVLRQWGHEVTDARDGFEGVAKALAGDADVMVVDIGLPGLDGYEVARRVRREMGAYTPVLLAMTGYGQPEDRRRASDAGFDSHMVKPLDLEHLKRLVTRIRRRAKAK
jgi:signal transduction histidine kinase/ActR/RegA family two-component response regulator